RKSLTSLHLQSRSWIEPSLRAFSPKRTCPQCQQGQALIEALVVFVVLLALLTAVAWVGRYQDIALQASHASRYVAFDEARGQIAAAPAIRSRFLTQPSHQWADRAGNRLFDRDENQVWVEFDRLEPLASHAQA